MVTVAPVIEPAIPPLGRPKRSRRAQFAKSRKGLWRFARRKIDAGGQVRQRSVGKLFGAVGRIKLSLVEACVDQVVANLFHVGVVVAERAVLIFNLHGNNGAAIPTWSGASSLP